MIVIDKYVPYITQLDETRFYQSTMAMPTGVGNKGKSLMEHLAAAKTALPAAEMHGQVLATTFPDTFLAGNAKGFEIRYSRPILVLKSGMESLARPPESGQKIIGVRSSQNRFFYF